MIELFSPRRIRDAPSAGTGGLSARKSEAPRRRSASGSSGGRRTAEYDDVAEGSSPLASVIVTAHDRREFVRDAIGSVLAQDIDRSAFELVVVKKFADPDLDEYLDRVGATRILSRSDPVNLKVAEGLRASRGAIVLLLEDDDLFEPSKLRRVVSEFRSQPDLGFYHHPVTLIGPTGEPLPPERRRGFGSRLSGRSRRVYLDATSKLQNLDRLVYSYPDFNSSSIAIRRELALASYPYLLRLEGEVDTFFFFAALVSNFGLLVDDVALTRYRVHSGNLSLASGPDPESRWTRLLEASRRQASVNSVIRDMVLRSGNADVLREVDGRILVNRLSTIFRDQRARRIDAVRALLQGWRLRSTLAVRENAPSIAGAALFAVAPDLARTGYAYQVAIR